jgi:hypothetical protein
MKNIMTFLGATIIASFIMVSCGQNSNKQKELELKERELALKEKEFALDSIQKISSNKTSVAKIPQTENNKVLSADNTSIDKTLSDQEYGKYSFDLPALQFYSIMIHFIRGGNNVTLTDITPPPDGEKYIENKENGTFVIDKVNSEFKYVTCKFKKGGIYKLKYSIKKKKWILLNQQDLMGNKIEIESY